MVRTAPHRSRATQSRQYRHLEMAGHFTEPPPLSITWDGRPYSARAGEPLAVTLLAHGIYTLGRSGKYHRARGMFCGVGSCGQCLARAEGLPNQRLCLVPATAGLMASSQNAMGTARFDALAAVDSVFFAGLDHHHLMTHNAVLNRMAVTTTRFLAGVGHLPDAPAAPTKQPPELRHCRICVVGAGRAGRALSRTTRRAGLETLCIDAEPDAAAPALGGCRAVGFYDDRDLVCITSQGRQLRIRADVFALCTGGYEQPPPCLGNDVPGVLSRRAAVRALRWGVLPGTRVVLASPAQQGHVSVELARSCAAALQAAGVEVAARLGAAFARADAPPPEALQAIEGAAPHLQIHSSGGSVAAQALIWCGPRLPAYELPAQMGVATHFADVLGGFLPRRHSDGSTAQPGLFLAGELCGLLPEQAEHDGQQVGQSICRALHAPAPSGALA